MRERENERENEREIERETEREREIAGKVNKGGGILKNEEKESYLEKKRKKTAEENIMQ